MNRTKTVPVLVSALTHINGCGGEILRRTGKRPKPPDTKIGIKSGKERKTEPSEEKNQKNRKFPAKNSSFRKICLYLQSQNESFGEGKAEKQPRNTRRDAGVVDRAALEMRCTGNCTGGSNPSLSARAGKAARKSQLFYFGEQPGLPEAARQNKKVAFRHFPALAGTPPAGKGKASRASQSRPGRRCRAVREKCACPVPPDAAGRQGKSEQREPIPSRAAMPRSPKKDAARHKRAGCFVWTPCGIVPQQDGFPSADDLLGPYRPFFRHERPVDGQLK